MLTSFFKSVAAGPQQLPATKCKKDKTAKVEGKKGYSAF
jgi:hypothetical protein